MMHGDRHSVSLQLLFVWLFYISGIVPDHKRSYKLNNNWLIFNSKKWSALQWWEILRSSMSSKKKIHFFFSKVSKLALMPNQPLSKWVPGAVSADRGARVWSWPGSDHMSTEARIRHVALEVMRILLLNNTFTVHNYDQQGSKTASAV
jgi:hypothetical protein